MRIFENFSFNTKTHKYLSVFSVLYVSVFFVYAYTQGFAFFIDSKTYLAGMVKEPFIYETLQFYPIFHFLHAFINCVLVVLCVQKRYNVLSLFLLAPYSMLLITNVTKEAWLFTSIAISLNLLNRISTVSLAKRKFYYYVALATNFSIFLLRPIYFAAYFVRWRFLLLGLVGFVIIYYALPEYYEKLFSELTRRITDRDLTNQNFGRDYFNYLCNEEKSDFGSLAVCLVPNFFFIPWHKDVFSFNYIIFLMFQIPINIILFKLFVSDNRYNVILAINLVFFYVLVYIMSPTPGAFTRYYYPFIWASGGLILFVFQGRVKSSTLRNDRLRKMRSVRKAYNKNP